MATTLTQIPTNKAGFIVGRYRLRHLDEHYSGGLGGVRWEHGVTMAPVEGHHLRRMVAAVGNQFSLEPWDEKTAAMPEVQAKLGDDPRQLARAHIAQWSDERLSELVEDGAVGAPPAVRPILVAVRGKGREEMAEAVLRAIEASGHLDALVREARDQTERQRMEAPDTAPALADTTPPPAAEPEAPQRIDDVPRCEVCDWPLGEGGTGCTGGLLGCSYRPEQGTDEYERIARRRVELQATLNEQPSGADTDVREPEMAEATRGATKDLADMSRSELREFAKSEGIADRVDLRKKRDDLEADIRRVLAGE